MVTVKEIIKKQDKEIMQGIEAKKKIREYHSSLSKYEDPMLFKIFGRIQDKLTADSIMSRATPSSTNQPPKKEAGHKRNESTTRFTMETSPTPDLHDISFINLREQFMK